MALPLNSLPLERRIIATLAFFEIFDFCLNLKELQFFLLGEYEKDLNKLKEVLNKMPEIGHDQAYYYLKGKQNLLKKRIEQNSVAQKFWKKVNFFTPLLQIIPFVEQIFVCNNLAFGSVIKKSDIDLFIITKKNRIFTTRILSTIFFHILGARRHGQKISKRFCLSFFVSSDNINLSHFLHTPYDIYFAFWFLSLKPCNNKTSFEDFLRKNIWINDYFENTEERIKNSSSKNNHLKLIFQKIFELPLKGKLGDLLENYLSNYFIKRHHNKLASLPANASVIVSKTTLKYHNDDQREKIQTQFETRLKELKII